MVHIHLDHRQIGLLIHADDFGVVLHAGRIILEAHPDAIGPFDHMPVGDDVSLGIDNHARTERALAHGAFALAKRILAAGTTEEMIEEIVHAASVVIILVAAAPVYLLDGRFGVDVNH